MQEVENELDVVGTDVWVRRDLIVREENADTLNDRVDVLLSKQL